MPNDEDRPEKIIEEPSADELLPGERLISVSKKENSLIFSLDFGCYVHSLQISRVFIPMCTRAEF